MFQEPVRNLSETQREKGPKKKVSQILMSGIFAHNLVVVSFRTVLCFA